MARKPNGQYDKGSNNYTEGHPKTIERVLPKEPRSLLRVLWEESGSREVFLKNLRKMGLNPKMTAAFFMMSANYLEGNPKQTTELIARQQPIFEIQRRPALTPPSEEPLA